ncbi:winged helix DNA-binding protein [Nocardia sp. CC227C]|uniref:winged helix DNA-binding protein n=1 Tax=Nocardia sp. CC227C TaxID=3044562 RepID=UPI00355855E4
MKPTNRGKHTADIPSAQVIGTLERAGYVTRIDDPGDGRAKLACLTARGRAATRVLGSSTEAVLATAEPMTGADPRVGTATC